MYDRIRTGNDAKPAVAAHGARVGEPARSERELPTVAVLPFDNLGSADDEYFAAGVTEEITSRLAVVSGLGVISRTSAMQYKESRPSLKQLGEELVDLEQRPDELERVEQRLALLGDLRRKYGASLAEVLEFAATAETRIEELGALLERADSLEAEVAAREMRVVLRHIGWIADDHVEGCAAGQSGEPVTACEFHARQAKSSGVGTGDRQRGVTPVNAQDAPIRAFTGQRECDGAAAVKYLG